MFRPPPKAIFESDESSGDDTDEDFSEKLADVPKKRRKALTGSRLSLHRPSSTASEDGATRWTAGPAPPKKPPASKKVNTIWSDLATEEQLVSGMGGSLQVKKHTVQRGVESYNCDTALLPPLDDEGAEERPGGQNFSSQNNNNVADTQDDAHLSDHSSTEMNVDKPKTDQQTDNRRGQNRRPSNNHNQKRRHFPHYHQKFPMHFDVEFSQDELKNCDGVEKTTPESDGGEKTTPSSTDEEKAEKLRRLAGKLAFALREPKVEIIETCLKCLGAEKCMQFFTKTSNIERHGGWLTVDKIRRRSPGGVFFALIKQDRQLSDENFKLIFGHNQRAPDERTILTATKRPAKKFDRSFFANPFEKSLHDLKALADRSNAALLKKEESEEMENGKVWKTRKEILLEECGVSSSDNSTTTTRGLTVTIENKGSQNDADKSGSSSSEDDEQQIDDDKIMN